MIVRSVRFAIVLLLSLWAAPALAVNYEGVQTLNLQANVSRSTSFSASTTNFPFLLLINFGSADAYVKLGNGPATTNDFLVSVGSCFVSGIGASANVSAISPGGPTTLRLAQADAEPGCAPGASLNFLRRDGSNLTSPAGQTNLGIAFTPSASDPLCDGRTTEAEIAAGTAHDCTSAINSVLSQVVNGYKVPVHLPSGKYYVTDVLNTNDQEIFGDGPTTQIRVRDTFSSSAAGVFKLVSGATYGAQIHDLAIVFDQPTTVADRANFAPLGTCTSGAGGTGCKYPPAVLTVQGSARPRVWNVRVEKAWDGFAGSCSTITTVHNPGGDCNNGLFWLDNIEMSALNVGWWFDGVLDTMHSKGFHYWNFGFSSSDNLYSVFSDGSNYCAKIGRVDGWQMEDIFCHSSNILSYDALTDVSVANLSLDTNAMLNITNSKRFDITNFSGSLPNSPTAGICSLKISGGRVNITQFFEINAITKIICVDGGIANINGGSIVAFQGQTSVAQTAGALYLSNVSFVTPATNRTLPAILQTGGAIVVSNVVSSGNAGATGPFLEVDADNASNHIYNMWLGGWGVSLGCSFVNGYCFTAGPAGFYDFPDLAFATTVTPTFATVGDFVPSGGSTDARWYLRGDFAEFELQRVFNTNAFTTAAGDFRLATQMPPPLSGTPLKGCGIGAQQQVTITGQPAFCRVNGVGTNRAFIDFVAPVSNSTQVTWGPTNIIASKTAVEFDVSGRFRVR